MFLHNLEEMNLRSILSIFLHILHVSKLRGAYHTPLNSLFSYTLQLFYYVFVV